MKSQTINALTSLVLLILVSVTSVAQSAVCYVDPRTGARYSYTYCPPQEFLEERFNGNHAHLIKKWAAVPTTSQKRVVEYYACLRDRERQYENIRLTRDALRRKQDEYAAAKRELQLNLLRVTARLTASTALTTTDLVWSAQRALRHVKESLTDATREIRQAKLKTELRRDVAVARAASRGFTNIDPPTVRALTDFRNGTRGQSIKNVSIKNKSFQQIDDELSGGGWGPAKTLQPGGDKQYVSKDGKWTKTVEVRVTDKWQSWTQVFYEHADGGVVRLKPTGMPDANPKFTHMRQPHGTKYVKKDVRGGRGFDNEAFKVDGTKPIPKVPSQIDFPDHLKKAGDAAKETYIQNNWKRPSHVPLRKPPPKKWKWPPE